MAMIVARIMVNEFAADFISSRPVLYTCILYLKGKSGRKALGRSLWIKSKILKIYIN